MTLYFKSKISSNLNEDEFINDLITDIYNSKDKNLFERVQIIVANNAMAEWLKYKIADKYNVCANLDFMTFPGKFITSVYSYNNKEYKLFDFDNATYILFEFFNNQQLYNDVHYNHLKTFLLDDQGKVQLYRAYQLSLQLKKIFFEYIFLRTEDLINDSLWKKNDVGQWQKPVWNYLINKIKTLGEKTYLDIFKYFMDSQHIINAPKELFIFNLPSVYPSQLKILLKMSKIINIYWYYSPISENYYGDLLAPSAKIKLEKKLMGYPNLSINDLYLLDGNPLVADLGGQSREFVELLLNNDIEIDFFNTKKESSVSQTMLEIIKDDILSINYRLDSQLRLNENSSFYVDPVILDDNLSIRINICYNKMREVQVMFNNIVDIIKHDKTVKLDDILVTSPNIDDYVTYIEAVFNNEYVVSDSMQQKKIPYSINAATKYGKVSVFESLTTLFSIPYHIPATFLLTVLSDTNIMRSLQIDNTDIELITNWLLDNNTHFGFSKQDYNKLNYQDQDIYSLKRFIINLTYGLYIPNEVSKNSCMLPIVTVDDIYTPYDNLEFSSSELLNKVVKIIDVIVAIRDFLYDDEVTLTSRDCEQFRTLLNSIKENIFTIEQDQLYISEITSSINKYNLPVNKLIILDMISEFGNSIKSSSSFTGRLNFSSMQDIRGVPFKVVYIMGMDNGKFPRIHNPDKLSILSNYWHIADRNYNLEDKQNFLDLILMAKNRLLISYVGIDEKNNNNLDPSPVLNLFLEVITNSFGIDKLNSITTKFSLHPFYNNCSINYSGYWKQISGKIANLSIGNRWNFNNLINSNNNDELLISAVDLIKTLLYTNNNLNKILQLTNFNDVDVEDSESFEFSNKKISKSIFNQLDDLNLSKNYYTNFDESLFKYITAKGIVSSGRLGIEQINSYLKVFNTYKSFDLSKNITLEYTNDDIKFKIIQQYNISCDNVLHIFNDLNKIQEDFSKQTFDAVVFAKILVYWSLINSTKTIIYDEQKNIIKKPDIQVHIINLNNEIKEIDFGMQCTADSLLSRIIEYYRCSLTYPTIFHKNAIQNYCSKNNKDNNSLFKDLTSKYNNYDLEKLKSDPIWSDSIENYESLLDIPNFRDSLSELAAIYNNIKIL